MHTFVLKNLTHNPYGEKNTSAPRMGASPRKKRFWKPFRADISHSDSNYRIVYRRMSPLHGGDSTERELRTERRVQIFPLDNYWIDPHGPALLPCSHAKLMSICICLASAVSNIC